MGDTFLCGQLAVIENLITVYSAAILALGTNGAQSYTLDTGQDRQTVTKLDLKDLRDTRDGFYNERAVLIARCNGSGAVQVVPGW